MIMIKYNKHEEKILSFNNNYLLFFSRNLSANTINITVKINLKNSVSFIILNRKYI